MDILLHSVTFSVMAHWVISQGYWIIFLAMLIEGPIVTAAAAFAVALGYFNLFAIFGLSLAGDLVADVIYYAIGYWGRITLVERFGHYFGLTHERIMRMESLMRDHAIKTLIALKLTPVLPTPGLMIVGATKMDLKKFATISILITLPKSIVFMIIGYYFGQEYDKYSAYVKSSGYVILAIAVVVIIANYLWIKSSARIGRAIEKF